MEYIANPFVIAWLVLGAIVAALALYRKFLSNREDDMVHLASGESQLVPKQISMAERLGKIDFWGKTLTIVLAISGLVLAGYFIYSAYQDSLKPVN